MSGHARRRTLAPRLVAVAVAASCVWACAEGPEAPASSTDADAADADGSAGAGDTALPDTQDVGSSDAGGAGDAGDAPDLGGDAPSPSDAVVSGPDAASDVAMADGDSGAAAGDTADADLDVGADVDADVGFSDADPDEPDLPTPECPSDVLGTACVVDDGPCAGPGTWVCDPVLALWCRPDVASFEACNGEDDDCDGAIDEDFALGTPCVAGVGACAAEGVNACEPGGPGVTCDAVPGAPSDEGCTGLDEDCDGLTDEGCDDDGDGWCDGAMHPGPEPEAVCPEGGGDCDDGNPLATPGAAETCETPFDDDCDGSANDPDAVGCSLWHYDGDGDGAGVDDTACLCEPEEPYTAVSGGDCNDLSGAESPLLEEVCTTPWDDDCDGASNAFDAIGCVTFYRDGDGDGFGVEGDAICACAALPPYTATVAGDCEDGLIDVNPLGTETCSGFDDDCDGTTDGMTGPCETACGEGTATCVLGEWVGCTAQVPDCTEGPCCDGCTWKPSGTLCGGAPAATFATCDAVCGGERRHTERWARCTGDSAACPNVDTGAYEDVDVGPSPLGPCPVGDACVDGPELAGLGADAVCEPCPFGCLEEVCYMEPEHVVCLDPAHGGLDPGATGGGLTAADLDLAIAQALAARLEADTADGAGGARWAVALTRTDDTTVGDALRANICLSAGAELVLSVAAGGAGTPGARAEHAPFPTELATTLATLTTAQLAAQTALVDGGVGASFAPILLQASAPAVLVRPGDLAAAGDAAAMAGAAFVDQAAEALLHGLQQALGYEAYSP